jgi:hypothetical protein
MTKRITRGEWEDLSAYLDGELSPRDSVRLEEKLQARPDLRQALNELSQTRALLRSQPALRAPRNFVLTPRMVGARQAPARPFQLFPAMRLATVMAAALLMLVLAGDFLTGGRQPGLLPVAYQSMPVSAPAAEMKAAPEETTLQGEVQVAMEAPSATEAPAEVQAEANMPEAAAPLPAPTDVAAAMLDATTGAAGYPAPVEEPLAEGYPPPVEEPPAEVAAIQQSTATSAPQPTPQPPEGDNLAERSALEASEPVAPEPAMTWSGWRILEVALLLLVVGFAGLAFYSRRSRRV